jgi:hypothetical protein
MVHDVIKPGRSSRPRPEDVCVEAFCEYLSYAKLRITTEAPCEDNELDYPTRHRQIRQSSGNTGCALAEKSSHTSDTDNSTPA